MSDPASPGGCAGQGPAGASTGAKQPAPEGQPPQADARTAINKTEAWRALARDMLEVPEDVLARRGTALTEEFSIACKLQAYPWGDLFIQVLQIRADHSRDLNDDVAYRASLLLGNLRAILLADATRAEPVIEAAEFLPRRGSSRRFMPCLPDRTRAKGFHAGGCQHPVWCSQRGECYYGHDKAGHYALAERLRLARAQ